MGIPGLWDILRPARREISLLRLTMNNMSNDTTHVGYRVGIDASIWFYHAAYGREGENHELRLIFFRLVRLLKLPTCIPLFVFDGPSRPAVKRGKTLTKKHHWMETGMKNLIEAFGFQWINAKGEAEAELAYLNRVGIIDAVMTDDVDALVFGASVVIRNLTAKGSPRAKSLENDDGAHVAVYRSSDIQSQHGPEPVGLSRAGLILVAILSGGDYDKGVPGCGIQLSSALARCGFGEELVRIGSSQQSNNAIRDDLRGWCRALKAELKTNPNRRLGRSHPSVANAIPETFPDIDTLRAYTAPVTSEIIGGAIKPSTLTLSRPNVAQIGVYCELYFEWGTHDGILRRFRDLIWPGVCTRILSSSVQVSGSQPYSHLTDTPDSALFTRIHSERCHSSTDMVLEYRVEVSPAQLAAQAVSTLKGSRQPSSVFSPIQSDPSSPFRTWIPAALARAAIPQLVAEFEERERVRLEKRLVRQAKRKRKERSSEHVATEVNQAGVSKRKRVEKGALPTSYIIISDDDDNVPLARR